MDIKKLISTATFKHSAISFAGTTITGILGLIFYSYVARQLSTSNYGMFSLSITTLALIASISNLGTDTGVIRFVSKFAQKNNTKSMQYLKLAFKMKLLIWIVILCVGWFITPHVARIFFDKPELAFPFRIALFGVGGMLFSSFGLSALQAYSKFVWWSVLNIGANLARLVFVLILGFAGVLVVENALWVYSGVLFMLFFVNLLLLPRFWRVSGELPLRKEFMGFNKWVAIFTAVAAIGSRMDTYLSARFLKLSNVGTYSVGVNLVSFVTQIVLALGSVVAPKLSSMTNDASAILYLKKLQLFVIVLGVCGVIVGIPLGSVVIPTIFGMQYAGSVLPFSILLVGQAIFLISVPTHMAVLYYFSYPKLFVYTTIFRLVIGFLVGVMLIPLYGETGAALSVLVGNIFDFLIPGIWVLYNFRK